MDKEKKIYEGYKKTKLGSYSTKYNQSTGQKNRNTNIQIAANTINNTILLPQEEFNWNNIIGRTTKEKGYKPAPTFANHGILLSHGGGVCQISSTLYQAAVKSNLQITERHKHSRPVKYISIGMDATVSYPGKNLRFKNNKNFPILIEASAKNGIITMIIYKLTLNE